MFLPLKKRVREHLPEWSGKRSVKDLIESMGVPHTEIGGIRVRNEWKDFFYIPRNGDAIEVLAASPECATEENPVYKKLSTDGAVVFVCDVHLWKLARRLRLLGFDARFDRRRDDAELAETARRENAILLTRDTGLLKRKRVLKGLYVHAIYPGEQVKEILQRLELFDHIRPFTRCLVCNGTLKRVDTESELFKEKLQKQIPPRVMEWTQEYHHCDTCLKVFWKGTHHDRLTEMIEEYRKR